MMTHTFTLLARATTNLFNMTQMPPINSSCPLALINFESELRRATSLPEQATGTLPVAVTVAENVRIALHNGFKKIPSSPAQQAHFKTLTDALLLTGYRLDQIAASSEEPAYHNRVHNLFVMGIRIVRGQRLLAQKSALSAQDYLSEARDIVSAMAHDLGHDGSTNTSEGTYEPAKLEHISAGLLQQILEQTKVPTQDHDYMRRTIVASDPLLPGEILLHASRIHFAHPHLALSRAALLDKIDHAPPSSHPHMHDLLTALEQDPALTQSAVALKCADMATSFGIARSIRCINEHNLSLEEQRHNDKEAQPDCDSASIAKTELHVMLNFIGTEICAPAKHGCVFCLRPQYPDPMSQTLFGEPLQSAFEECVRASGTDGIAIIKSVMAKYNFALSCG